MKSRHLVKISEALAENRELQDCDLCSNKICRKEKELNQYFIRNIAVFAYQNRKLRHLSLQGMHLSLAIEEESALVKRAGASPAKDDAKAPKKDKKGGKGAKGKKD
jgi:hypothetical protein